MRLCLQRVSEASVRVDGELVGQIEQGLLVLLGVAPDDTLSDVEKMADKTCHLRVFEDDQGKMNRSLLDIGGSMLVVSQFTLLGDCRKGRRPSFVGAAEPEKAERFYEHFVARVAGQGVQVATGKFRAMMDVTLVNQGPVTLILESN